MSGKEEGPAPRPDYGRHADDYASHRPGPPPSVYERLDAVRPLSGARILDLATGPGTLALELVRRGASVVGVDVSEEQIATARRAAREHGFADRVRFEVGRAERTGLDADAFDLVTAGQCWHWFDADAVVAEVARVLRPGGLLAIVHYSYLVEHDPVARDTEALVLDFNPAWTMTGWTGVFPGEIDEVIRGGLRFVEAFCYDYEQGFSHEGWRGRMRACSGVGASDLSPDEVRRFDDALADLLRDRYPDPLTVTHRVWCVLGRATRRDDGGTPT